MKNKKSIFILLLISTLVVNCIDKKNSDVKKIKGGSVSLQTFDSESEPFITDDEVKELLKKYPNFFEVFYDYGNYWVNKNDKSNCLIFEYYSGKLIQFKDIKTLNSPINSNKVFVFQVASSNPIKITGEFGFREGDTLMHWTYDEIRNELVNESGVVFKQMKIR